MTQILNVYDGNKASSTIIFFSVHPSTLCINWICCVHDLQWPSQWYRKHISGFHHWIYLRSDWSKSIDRLFTIQIGCHRPFHPYICLCDFCCTTTSACTCIFRTIFDYNLHGRMHSSSSFLKSPILLKNLLKCSAHTHTYVNLIRVRSRQSFNCSHDDHARSQLILLSASEK